LDYNTFLSCGIWGLFASSAEPGTREGVRTLAGYATSRHGQARFVISFKSKNGALRFRCDLPPSDGAKSKLGIADVKEGNHAAEEAFG